MNYSEGDVVIQATFGGGMRRVRIEYREDDVKNGYPGFVGDILDGNDAVIGQAWGYDDQIVGVE